MITFAEYERLRLIVQCADVRCFACGRPLADPGVTCLITPSGGWVCNHAIEGNVSDERPQARQETTATDPGTTE